MQASDLFPVILTYGIEQTHLELAGQLVAQSVPAENCLVVHNPSEPGEGLPQVPEGFRSVRMDRNGGYGCAMNRGIREQLATSSEVLLLLTHDTRLGPGAIAALVEAAGHHEDVGVFGFVLDRVDDRSFGGMQFPDGSVAHVEQPPAAIDGIVEVPWVDGSALAVRVAALAERDPLPEHYFMYFEEVWLCSGLRRRGWRTATVVDAVASSSPGWSRRPAAQAYLFTRNGIDCLRRARGRRWALRFAGHQLRLIWRLAPKPGGERFRDPRRRRLGYALVLGRALGLLDAVRGRWGPPPPFVLGRGDISGT